MRSRRLLVGGLAAATLLGSSLVSTARASGATATCDIAFFQGNVPADTTITAAASLSTADGFEYCRVDGAITTTGPGPNTVRFEVSLPDQHNGRFYFQGLGGTAGLVKDPDPVLLAAGYAFASSDTGNQTGSTALQREGLNWSFMGDAAVALDHDRRGAHVSTTVAQHLTKQYYGTDDLVRYHSGCSGGGRMGWNAGVWYPDDYDGIVIGAAGRDVGNILHFGKVAQYVRRNGLVATPALAGQFIAVGQQILADFDAADGAIDGMIWDPSAVRYTDAELDALLAGFVPEWRTMIDMIIAGYDVGGATFMPQYPISGFGNWTAWLPFPGFFFPEVVFGTFAAGILGPTYDWVADFDFDSVDDEQSFVGPMAADNLQFGRSNEGALLDGFRDAGGKVLFWHGVNDPVISYNVAPLAFDEIVESSGNLAQAQRWARLFPVPGISHCGGGDGPADVPYVALEALTRWVEDGKAPASLVAERPADGRTFLLCPYPQRSVFRGGVDNTCGLDVADAANWVCRNPNYGR